MKKILLSIALLSSVFSLSARGRSVNMGAFNNLSVGVEAGTTGTGISLYMPVIDNHLVVSVGYNFPAFSAKSNVDIETGKVNNSISEHNSTIDQLNAYTSQYGIPFSLNKLSQIDGNVKLDNKLNLVNAKIMLEYYPSTKHTFHITAGVFIGKDNFIDVEGHSSASDWNTYKSLLAGIDAANATIDLVNETSGQHLLNKIDKDQSELTFSVDDKNYIVKDFDGDGTGDVNGSLLIQKVKPYLGIGFGRSLPNKRVGFQFEIGAWYHGTPELRIDNPVSKNGGIYSDNSLGDLMKEVKKANIYPQITFRLVGRLF